MDLQQLLAQPLVPSIRILTSPDDELFIDQALLEARRAELIEFCRSIPGADLGPSWRMLKIHTNGNGRMAKMLIALGDLLGVWTMHPRVDVPQLWGSGMYPMILAGSVVKPEPRRAAKPSAGDLEEGVEQCPMCGRQVSPTDSPLHPPTECDNPDCPMESALKVPPRRARATLAKKAEAHEVPSEEGPPPGLESYLKNING